MEKRHSEKRDLARAVRGVRDASLARVRDHKTRVASRLKVVAWNSQAKQSRALETIAELRRELGEALDEHTAAETDMRRANLGLEVEVRAMIGRYDEEMFSRHEDITR